MGTESRGPCACKDRNRLVGEVLSSALDKSRLLVKEEASPVAMAGNICLLQLSQYMLVMLLLTDPFEPEKDSEFVSQFKDEDFRVFSRPSSDVSAEHVRDVMEAAQRNGLDKDVLYESLAEAAVEAGFIERT